jgi:hypothetical protein
VYLFTQYDFQDGADYISNWDEVNSFTIPPLGEQITLSTSEKSITLRPAEKKILEVRVNSSAKLVNSFIGLSADPINGLEIYFNPNKLNVGPDSFATSQLGIKAAADSKPNLHHQLQIDANIHRVFWDLEHVWRCDRPHWWRICCRLCSTHFEQIKQEISRKEGIIIYFTTFPA